MPKEDTPLAFLAQAQRKGKLGARVEAAVVRGNQLTADEVLEIAREFGYTFTRAQFESEIKKDITRRFNEGDEGLADVAAMIKTRKPPPLKSTCAAGCLSYTISYHPPDFP